MELDAWSNFTVAQVGASAALLGLLFVGLSQNLAKILSIASLADRSLTAMILLFSVMLVSSLLLVPGQSEFVIGAEVLAVGFVTWLACLLLARSSRRIQSAGHFVLHFALLQVATLPYVIAGAMLMAGQASGMYWFVAAVIGSLFKAVSEAWVLLIEINR